MTLREKALFGITILAIVIAAASLTQVYVVTAYLNEQIKKTDALSSKLDALSLKQDAVSYNAADLSSKFDNLSNQVNQLSGTKSATGTRTIYMVAIPDIGGDQYDKLYPQTIIVQKGDKVRIVLTNIDDGNDHGFDLAAFGVNKVAKSLETITIEFVADNAGIFEFHCSVYCGTGHPQMTGQLIVLG